MCARFYNEFLWLYIRGVHGQAAGCMLYEPVHPDGAQNKTLISNTAFETAQAQSMGINHRLAPSLRDGDSLSTQGLINRVMAYNRPASITDTCRIMHCSNVIHFILMYMIMNQII